MSFDPGRKSRVPSPWINLFWLVLFLPVSIILRLLWKKKVSWLNGPSLDGQPR